MQSPDDLPEPAGLLAHEDGSGFVDCYTAEQMRAYRAAGVAQERERCSMLARSAVAHAKDADWTRVERLLDAIDAIRAGRTTS
jgi:hypothetical protein